MSINQSQIRALEDMRDSGAISSELLMLLPKRTVH